MSGVKCTAADEEFWRTGCGFFKFNDTAFDVGVKTLGQRDKTEVEVTKAFSDYSTSCQQCMTDIIVCTGAQCFGPCFTAILQERSAQCDLCVAEQCDPAFNACAGWDVTQCGEPCKNPCQKNLTPVFAGVGVAVAIILSALLFFAYKRGIFNELLSSEAQNDRVLAGIGLKTATATATHKSSSKSPRAESFGQSNSSRDQEKIRSSVVTPIREKNPNTEVNQLLQRDFNFEADSVIPYEVGYEPETQSHTRKNSASESNVEF